MLSNNNIMGRNGCGIALKENGFTLVELVVVTLIISILVGMAVPSMNHILARYRLSTAARQLAGDIRYVQQMAVGGESTRVYILFDVGNRLYFIKKNNQVLEQVQLPQGISFMSVPFSGKQLAFSIDGAPTGAGEIILQNEYAGLYKVIVMPATGRVRLESQ